MELVDAKSAPVVVPYIGTWIETAYIRARKDEILVVPYIGTWIETKRGTTTREIGNVVPYIGTWIETVTEKTLLTLPGWSYLI